VRDEAEPNLRSRSSRDGKRSSGAASATGGALLAWGLGEGGPSIEEGRGLGDGARRAGMDGAVSPVVFDCRGAAEDDMYDPVLGSRTDE
jgi:hypothetical protein